MDSVRSIGLGFPQHLINAFLQIIETFLRFTLASRCSLQQQKVISDIQRSHNCTTFRANDLAGFLNFFHVAIEITSGFKKIFGQFKAIVIDIIECF